MIDWNRFIQQALEEDVGEGDHTSLSCISPEAEGSALLHIKDDGILAGVDLAEKIFLHLSPSIKFTKLKADGDLIQNGETAFEISAKARTILKCERLVLNCMQRMSGIATLTREYVKRIEGFKSKILDTRKTTPLFRAAEKWAVRIGGGENHRFGLYDMILIKDNHIDYAGGIVNALVAARNYLEERKFSLRVEIEARTLHDAELILKAGNADRIMLDNFSLPDLRKAIEMIGSRLETEASGGITLETVRDVASTGVNYISVGALTHSYRSLDMSLKAKMS
ncbi:MAG: carboxylating nicotinate-nucleotide diphosphorylase [Chitinophagales bacterium]